MARVVLVGNLAQLTGGVAEFDLSATSVKQLFRQLAELYPAIARHLEDGVAVAIDGQIFQDALLEPIGPESEVFVLPQIAGGSGHSAGRQPAIVPQPLRSFGSSASRSESPKRLKPNTPRLIAMPGKMGIQGAFSAYDSAEPESMSPHDGVGSAAPSPRYERAA